MTPAQISLVQNSFSQVVPIRDVAAGLFYDRLFALDPATRTLFTNSDMGAQGQKLMATIGTVVAGLGRPEAVVPAAQALARRHVGYGVTAAHYGIVGEALLWTLERGLGEGFTPEVRCAWVKVYGVLAATMQAGAAEVADLRAAE